MFLKYRYFRKDKAKVLGKLRRLLEGEEEALLAIVFGSFVDLESFRDIDLAIYSRNESLNYLARLGARLELELEIPIDVVPLKDLEPRFRWKILRKGIIIVEKKSGLYEALLNITLDELENLAIS